MSFVNRTWGPPLLTFLLALVALGCAIGAWGATRGVDKGDPEQYLAIGKSLAVGNGYKDTVGPWPDLPSYDRMPGWPVMIAAGLKLLPSMPEGAADRTTAAVCLAIAGMFFTVLQRRLGIGAGLAVAGGLAVALSPGMVAMAMGGYSEPAFLALLAAAIAATLAGLRWHYAAAVLFGLAPLVRTNFVLAPSLLVFLLLAFPAARLHIRATGFRRLVLLLLIAITPTIVWAGRNFSLTGRFPLLSSLEGEALWGANNPVVANDLKFWGYWIVPDSVPGEIPKVTLARDRTDLQLSDYYHAQAISWIRGNLRDLPRFILGKMVRGFVPLPWLPVVGTWVAFSYRFLLDALYIILVPWWLPSINRLYLLICLAAFMVNLLTVVIYYGSFRFTHCAVEVFFVPCILLGLQNWRSGRRLKVVSDPAPG